MSVVSTEDQFTGNFSDLSLQDVCLDGCHSSLSMHAQPGTLSYVEKKLFIALKLTIIFLLLIHFCSSAPKK